MVTKRMVQHLYIQNKDKNYRKHNLSSYISMMMRVQRKKLTVKFMYRDSRRQIRQSFFPSIRSTFDNQVILPDIFDYSNIIIKVHSLKPIQRLYKSLLTQAIRHFLTRAKKLRKSGKERKKKGTKQMIEIKYFERHFNFLSTIPCNQIYGELLIYHISLGGL